MTFAKRVLSSPARATVASAANPTRLAEMVESMLKSVVNECGEAEAV